MLRARNHFITKRSQMSSVDVFRKYVGRHLRRIVFGQSTVGAIVATGHLVAFHA